MAYYDHRLLVRVKPNINNKAKIYYGWISKDSDITGKEVVVAMTHPDGQWSHCYYWSSSIYIDREDCEILQDPYKPKKNE